MRRFVATFLLASLAMPAMAQAPQPLQQQVDGVTGQIDRLTQSMGSLLIQQKARIDDLEAQVAALTKSASAPIQAAPTPPSPILPPAPK